MIAYNTNLFYLDSDFTWLDLSFLRALRMLFDFEHLVDNYPGSLNFLGEFHRTLLRTLLRTIALVVSFAGVIFSCEVLGDLGWGDPYHQVVHSHTPAESFDTVADAL